MKVKHLIKMLQTIDGDEDIYVTDRDFGALEVHGIATEIQHPGNKEKPVFRIYGL